MTEKFELDPTIPAGFKVPATAAEVSSLTKVNDLRLKALEARGFVLDQASITTVRLMAFLDHKLGALEESAERVAYEHCVQLKFDEILTGLESQVNKAVLLQGVNGVKS